MKFRALIVDPAAMRDFMNITLSLSKFSKDCVMRITTRRVYFIISEEDCGPRRPLVWCELPVNFYFKEFNVVGVNTEYNEIYLEFSTALLARSLSILKQTAKSLKIKLTNKETPCLTIEMELMAGEIISRQVVHDIPVEVISRRHWSDYEEPRFNDFHVSIQMPNLKALKSIVEKMKNMSHSLIVSANKNGRLTFQIKTNVVSLSSHFTDLSVQSFAVGQIPTYNDGDEDMNAQVIRSTVDIKKFLIFLSGLQINNCQTFCSIVEGKMVKLNMEQPGALSIQIFLAELNV
ncbi:hus1-like checkpoint clamp component [Leptinotarsa decemlineata]|uniref:hus1-like checkpoint clamp component n=1 Tax=Leptinotarsa decemlineata TaxID=7539 RepID=UPI000C2543AD|nr:checkpoint protein HUS1 [Leptinotarsa decemlineata]